MTEQELVSRHNDIMARMRSWKAECESEAEQCFGLDAIAADGCKTDSTVYHDMLNGLINDEQRANAADIVKQAEAVYQSSGVVDE